MFCCNNARALPNVLASRTSPCTPAAILRLRPLLPLMVLAGQVYDAGREACCPDDVGYASSAALNLRRTVSAGCRTGRTVVVRCNR